jgi:chromosome partitioning protein
MTISTHRQKVRAHQKRKNTVATIVSCVNLKGGVGKTTLAVNMAAYFGKKNKRTLLIDLDPQTNATFSCMEVDAWTEHAKKFGTVADLLGARQHTNATAKQKTVKDVALKSVFKNVDLVPSHLDLFTIDLDMASATARETRLRKALSHVDNEYDVIICDCPPNLTIPTQNALAASSFFVVPISADFLSALGVGILLSRVKKLGDDLDQKLKLGGIVISRVGRPAFHRDEIVNQLRSTFTTDVLNPVLTERVRVAEAAAKQKSVFEVGDATAIAEFDAVYADIAQRIGI